MNPFEQAFRLLDIEPPRDDWWESLRSSQRVQLLVEVGYPWDDVLAPLLDSVRGTSLEPLVEKEREWKTANSARSAVVLVDQWLDVEDVWRDRYDASEVSERLFARLSLEVTDGSLQPLPVEGVEEEGASAAPGEQDAEGRPEATVPER